MLALHSSSTSLAVGVLNFDDPLKSMTSQCFDIGRKLSNDLFSCVAELLPAKNWTKISRLAVCIGPGGFTGTRLTVAMTRTIAQQLKCPLDGISSYALMAPRLCYQLDASIRNQPFWISTYLERRGTVAGQYKVLDSINDFTEVIELKKPNLLNQDFNISPRLDSHEDPKQDVIRLLNVSFFLNQKKEFNSWENVFPIYPTSPIDKLSKV